MIVQRKHSSPRVLEVRPLVEADLEYLRQKSIGSTRVNKLRDSHHNVCWLLALGLRHPEVAQRTGYSIGRVATLAMDPAVQDQVAKYSKVINEGRGVAIQEEADEIIAGGTRAMAKYIRQVNDHFDQADEAGELLPISSLAKIGPDLMDRFGYGKKTHNTSVSLNFAAELEAGIARKDAYIKKVAAE